MISAGTYCHLSWLLLVTIANFSLATYLDIPRIARPVSPIDCGSVGAGIGFLWYNAYPAQVFMGDVGSLALGSGSGMLAVCTKNELLSVLLGGIFFVETLSVITQVVSFRLTGEKNLLDGSYSPSFSRRKGGRSPRLLFAFGLFSRSSWRSSRCPP